MSSLQNKIDFVVLVKVNQANPNGDPLNGNRPRTNYAGNGEISDVCIKRKIRNRLQDMGEKLFVQMAERSDDGYTSLSERASKTITSYRSKEDYAKQACENWIDVRTFGQVFAFKPTDKKEKDKDGVSVGVRGPVSIHQAISCSPIDINTMQITKSVNSEPSDKKGSDTMGSKHLVEFGLYKIKGSINVQLAEKTGFSEEDAEKIKEALRTLFINDASAARPDGSMEVVRIYWWKHNNKIGQYSAAKVHDSLKIELKEGVMIPGSVDDYMIRVEELPGLEPEIIEGM
jgi:CRISPR-associated protein Csd2